MSCSDLTQAIITARLFDGQQWHNNHCVMVRGEQIIAVTPLADLPAAVRESAQHCQVLAPGSTPLSLYRELIESNQRGEISFRQVQVFGGCRGVPSEYPIR
jgi:hypothetical protein